MANLFSKEVGEDLLSRGFSRRQMIRIATLLGGASAVTALNPEMGWARGDSVDRKMVAIGSNTWGVGPMAAGVAAATANFAKCNSYSPGTASADLIRTVSQIEKIPEDHITYWPGSTEGLNRILVAFCSPTRGFVQASPSFDNAKWSALFMKAPVKEVPLKADYSHDVKAMLAADPNAGVYYINNPNNPTATMTSMADIEWLVANKPAGSVVLLDEAYIHCSDDYPNNTGIHLVQQGRDVFITRTFSKIFAMAGARLGLVLGRPDLLKKLVLYNNGGPNPVASGPAIVCGTVSLMQADEIAKRRREMFEARNVTFEFLRKRRAKVLPSQANFFMLDWKDKSARDMQLAFRAHGVQIGGPRWPVWPTVSRISIGTKDDMHEFIEAFDKVMPA